MQYTSGTAWQKKKKNIVVSNSPVRVALAVNTMTGSIKGRERRMTLKAMPTRYAKEKNKKKGGQTCRHVSQFLASATQEIKQKSIVGRKAAEGFIEQTTNLISPGV